jgi:hypothetical protein
MQLIGQRTGYDTERISVRGPPDPTSSLAQVDVSLFSIQEQQSLAQTS